MNSWFNDVPQVGQRGDAQAGAEAESPSVWQRGDGGISANHGSQAEETHSNQEGEGPGLEGAEGEGKYPQATGWIEEEEEEACVWFLLEAFFPDTDQTAVTWSVNICIHDTEWYSLLQVNMFWVETSAAVFLCRVQQKTKMIINTL